MVVELSYLRVKIRQTSNRVGSPYSLFDKNNDIITIHGWRTLRESPPRDINKQIEDDKGDIQQACRYFTGPS